MQRPTRFILGVFTVGLVGISAIASASLAKPTAAVVKFTAMGPAGLKIEGTTSQIDVSDDAGNVTITVPLSSVHTGIDLRDRHMKEDLEVEKFPTAQFTVARSSITFPKAGESKSGDAVGTLKLHGQSKPATVHYDVKTDGGEFVVDGKLHVNTKDVGINVRSYLGVTVKPDVDVDVHFRVSGA
jgi:polyisoprenoid-binding protein YceI